MFYIKAFYIEGLNSSHGTPAYKTLTSKIKITLVTLLQVRNLILVSQERNVKYLANPQNF